MSQQRLLKLAVLITALGFLRDVRSKTPPISLWQSRCSATSMMWVPRIHMAIIFRI